jgi:AcrR family transcriptional regulator
VAAAAPSTFRLEARRRYRRERLLSAALQLFAERGFHETSVDDVVAAARTSKSAFYDHFESKEDCFRVLLEQEGGELIAAVQAAAAAGSGPRQRLRLGIFTFVRACAARARVARLLLFESVGLCASVESVRHRLHQQFAGMVEVEARHAQARGELVGLDPGVYGKAVVGAVNEAVGWFLATPDGDPDALAERLCRVFSV